MSDQADDQSRILKEIQALIQNGAFSEAHVQATEMVKKAPESLDAHYMKAVCERYLGQHDIALASLQKLKSLAPEFGRAFQEEGHVWRATGQIEKALAAYRQAVRANPALIASWRAQRDLLQASGNSTDAAEAAAQLTRLNELPGELLAVINLLHEGKLQRAENLCRTFLQKSPHHIEAMRLLAEIAVRFGVYQEAEFLLESAAELDPDNIQVRLDYIQVLRKRQKFAASLREAEALRKREPDNPLFQSLSAIEAMQTGDHDTAFELFDRVLEKVPGDPATLTSRGHALKTVGRQDEAIESYRAAVNALPAHGDAWYSLANLKTYRFSDNEIATMRREVAAADLSFMQRVYFLFTLGKALEDRGDFENSFQYYQQGNELKRARASYQPEQMTAELAAQRAVCTGALFEKQGGKGCPAPDPIFIVGLPRAGSTLLEQILASHSQIEGTLELPNILALAHRLRGRDRSDPQGRYPGILHDLPADKLRGFGETFLAETQIHRTSTPFFIDKMPNNFRHIGLIHLILPNAKIIDARRAPLDCCFSGFTQLFAEGQEFTYGLEVIGQYYRDYVEMMRHWDNVLPGKILRVQHEDVLDDLEGQVRRMLEFLNVPFEDACLDFHKTARPVRTASSEQVRQPINKKGVGKWKPYEPWLGPLKQALGPALTEYAE